MNPNYSKMKGLMFTLFMVFMTLVSQAQTFNVYIANDRLTSSTTLEFDIYVVSTSTDFNMRTYQTSIAFNSGFIPSGSTITPQFVNSAWPTYSPGTVSWSNTGFAFQGAVNTGVSCATGLLVSTTPIRLATWRLNSTLPFNCAPHNVSFIITADALPPGIAIKSAVTKWNTNDCSSGLNTTISNLGTYTKLATNTLYTQVNNQKPKIATQPLPVSGCAGSGNAQFSVTATGNGTGSQVNYQWLDNGVAIAEGGSFTGTTSSTLTISNPGAALNGHLYSAEVSQCTPALKVTSNAVALNLTSVTISPASGPLAGGSVGVAYAGETLTSTGGTGPYSYSLSAGALPTGLNLSPSGIISGTASTSGTFNFTVTSVEQGSCSGTATYSINIAGGCAVTGTATTTPVTCNGNTDGTATVTLAGNGAGAPGTYTVDGGSAVNYSSNPFTVTGLSVGNHTIVATVTAGGCVSSNIPVNIGGTATFSATYTKVNVPACNVPTGGSITVTPSGGTAPYTYSWTGMTGAGNANQTPFTAGNVSSLTGLTWGFYNVTITDAGGCGVVTINNIHIESAYTVYVTNNGSVSSSCGNPVGSIILYGNAGVQPYTYSIDGSSYQASNTFLNLAAGTYTGYIKDAAGCIGTKTGITVGTAPALVVFPYARAASSCADDGSIEIYRTGGIGPYTYSLDGTTYQNGNVYTNKAAGNYTAYVKDSKGCISTASITVAQGAGLTVTANKAPTSTCVADGSFQVNVTGGVAPFTYSKDNVTFQASNSFTGLMAGTYTAYVKDVKGCTGQVNVTINLNTINVSSYVVAATSCASSNGSIQLYRTGGVGPYTYSLDGMTYQSSNTFTNLPAGTYDGYVKDSKTCTAVQNGIVVGPTGCMPTVANKSKGVQPAIAAELKVQAYPNPSTTEFTLQLTGFDVASKVSVTVTDVLGRKVYQTEGTGKLQYRFGNGFKAGIYSVQVIQGDTKKSLKLIKE